jgi:DNA-binding beta-propeller fold protein YncE
MHRFATAFAIALAVFTAPLATARFAAAQDGPYKVLATTKVGGEGGMDYVFADSDGRKLYVARSGAAGHVGVFDLDSLKLVGDITGVSAHGATVDTKYGHGIAASKPVAFFDAKTFAVIKKLDVQGNPDGYLTDAFNDHMYILSHSAPNVTVIDAKDGAILGTIDLGGAPEQAVSDGKGHLYIDLEDKDAIAVVDAQTMKMTGKFDVSSKGGGCAGLAIDAKNGILFATCRDKSDMIILSAKDGAILADLPTGKGSDGATFNPATMEAFSSQGDGTLTIVKENSPTSFVVEQTVKTPIRAKTLTLDAKTGKIFLITAEYAAPAAPATPPAAGARPARPTMVPDSFMIVTVGK